MNGTEVELDTLTDTDRTGAEDENLLLLSLALCLILTSKAGVIVWSFSCKLSRTGIYHLEGSTDAVCMTHLLDLVFRETSESRDHMIREFDALCFL